MEIRRDASWPLLCPPLNLALRRHRPVVPRCSLVSRYGTLGSTLGSFVNQSPSDWFADVAIPYGHSRSARQSGGGHGGSLAWHIRLCGARHRTLVAARRSAFSIHAPGNSSSSATPVHEWRSADSLGLTLTVAHYPAGARCAQPAPYLSESRQAVGIMKAPILNAQSYSVRRRGWEPPAHRPLAPLSPPVSLSQVRCPRGSTAAGSPLSHSGC